MPATKKNDSILFVLCKYNYLNRIFEIIPKIFLLDVDGVMTSGKFMYSKKGKIYFNTISRDRKKLDICVADITNGEVTVLIEERFNTYIESNN